MTDAADLTATEALAAVRAGQLTSEDLVRACLARVDARDDAVQAWAYLDRDLALRQARARGLVTSGRARPPRRCRGPRCRPRAPG